MKAKEKISKRDRIENFILHLGISIIVTIFSASFTSSDEDFFTHEMRKLFLNAEIEDSGTTFADIGSVEQIWAFLRGPLLDGLYWRPLYDPRRQIHPSERNNILFENKLVGMPRICQVRVHSKSCHVQNEMKTGLNDDCYGVYNWRNEVKPGTKFGNTSGSQWIYRSAEQVGGGRISGKVATYRGGGAYLDFTRLKTMNYRLLSDMEKDDWVDAATRAVVIDFSVYNTNTFQLCFVKLLFELPAFGGVLPSAQLLSVNLRRYGNQRVYFLLGIDLCLILITVWMTVKEAMKMLRLRMRYFSQLKNFSGLLLTSIALICIYFAVICQLQTDKTINTMADIATYANFAELKKHQRLFDWSRIGLVFMVWANLFQHIRFNRTMSELSDTFIKCSTDVTGFAILFSIVFFSFAQNGYLLFGSQVESYSTFKLSCFTLLKFMLGDFNFYEIESVHHILGPVFFLAYIFFVCFMMLNMFLAILGDTYVEVKTQNVPAANN